MLLDLVNISKNYPGFSLDPVSFSIESGQSITIVGASGSGKSTILKCINRLIKHDSGDIYFQSRLVQVYDLLELRKQISYLFQKGLVFPHLTVEQNLKVVGENSQAQIIELLEFVELDYNQFANRYPRELSGGQEQRLALAQSLIHQPKLLLLDEPFNGLDLATKSSLIEKLKKLQESKNIAMILVTHNQDELDLFAANQLIQLNEASYETR